MTLELKYALRKDTNELVFVDDVLNGLQCECICTCCKKTLVAKNEGQKREHHFAHYSGVECKNARMTALHLMAQNILQTTKQVMLPAYNGAHVQRKARITFEEVRQEENIREQGIIRKPDCIGIVTDNKGDTHTLWIEICVTHEVDEEKAKDINTLRKHCIEINLHDMLDTDYDEQSVKERLLTRTDDRQWICYPELDDKDDRFRLQALEDGKARRLQEAQEQQERKRKIQEEKERCKQLAKTWLQNPTEELTQQVIQSISTHPFNNEVSVCDFLFSNWIDLIGTLPKNEYGLRVFYTMLNYYWKNVNFDDKVYKNTIYKLWFKKDNLTIDKTIELECLVSLCIVERLAQPYYGFVPETYKTLKRTFTKNADFRKRVFMILSFRYYHPFGCGINSFEELASQIKTSYPTLIPLLLQALESIQQYYPQSLALINGNTLIEEFRKIDCSDISSPKEIESILQICFPNTFRKEIKAEPEFPTALSKPTQTDNIFTEAFEREWKELKEWYNTHANN